MGLLLRYRWLSSALGGTMALVFGLSLSSGSVNQMHVEAEEIEKYEIVEIEPEGIYEGRKYNDTVAVELNNELLEVVENELEEPVIEEAEPVIEDAEPTKEVVSIGQGVLADTTPDEDIVLASAPYNVPNHIKGCKSYNVTYMSYTAVTSKTSNQYKLLNSDMCITDEATGIRIVNDRYCVALGSYYTHEVGRYVDLVFKDGSVVKCVVGDCKADADTDDSNRFHSIDGSVAEFVVDMKVFNSTSQWSDLLGGDIVKVVVLDEGVCWEDI